MENMTENEDKKVVKEKSKVGHRRVSGEGTVTYKRKTTSEIQQAIQLGIKTTVVSAHNMAKRDMLLKDFGVVETLSFPKTGSKDTQPHSLADFKFKTFAPIAFRYFRDFFEVDIGEYLNSICHQELRELSNAGASGAIFYITRDDEFIIKTVQHKEASFLQKLLPEYYINLMQHPRTLLPKFYGLYCYQTMGKNIRFVIMNNLLPSIKIHEKYDLKGSTYKRIASIVERTKSSPTLKDLDFRENHPDGLFLEVDTYEALVNTIQRDCRVLESFRIMDYSLLLGIHNLDVDTQGKRKKSKTKEEEEERYPAGTMAADISVFDEFGNRGDDEQISEIIVEIEKVLEKVEKCENIEDIEKVLKATSGNEEDQGESKSSVTTEYFTPGTTETATFTMENHNTNQNQQDSSVASTNQNNTTAVVMRHPLNRQASKNKSIRRIAAYSTVLESIQAPIEKFDLDNNGGDSIPSGGIPARNKLGDRLILFMGIIDILQSYRLMKKLEHNMKAIFLDAETISVTNPSFYGQRFQEFFGNIVFRKIPSLDQPQMLGNHARRFRNFVHLAMRQQQQPPKKSLVITQIRNVSRKSTDTSEEVDLTESDTRKDDSEEVGQISEKSVDEEVKIKKHIFFSDMNSSE